MKAMSQAARDTWLRIQRRFESGDPKITPQVRKLAEEMLEVRFVRQGRSKRPDAVDQAANDTSVSPAVEDGMVIL